MTTETNKLQTDTPHCWSCKKEIGPADRFCPHCGAKVRDSSVGPSIIKCPTCYKPISSQLEFCPNCGTNIAKAAPSTFATDSGASSTTDADVPKNEPKAQPVSTDADNQVEQKPDEKSQQQHASTPYQCWSCKAEISPTDILCPHCGTRLMYEASTTEKLQEQHASTNAGSQTKQTALPQWLDTTKRIVVGIVLIFGIVMCDKVFGPLFPDTLYCSIGAGVEMTVPAQINPYGWSTAGNCNSYIAGCATSWRVVPAREYCAHGTLWDAIVNR
jgi:rRNA maturation endonuclease Nob1